MKRTIFLLALSLFVTELRAAPSAVEFAQNDGRIDVLISGRLFTSYHFSREFPKPILVPVRTPSGIEINRRNPLVRMEGGSMDHEHHVGIFFAVDRVNGINFWKNTKTSPQIRHEKIVQMACDNGKGQL